MKNLFFFFLFFTAINSEAQIINDESYLDIDFLKFKTALSNCIIEKDTTKLKMFLADNVLDSNDGCGYPGCSQDELINHYFKENATASWDIMAKIIRYGFSRLEDQNPNQIVPHEKLVFKGPSYLNKINISNELVVLGENVNIRAEPGTKALVLRTASFETFECNCNVISMTEDTYTVVNGVNWIQIKLENEQLGYVAAHLTSHSVPREMTVAKIKGKWKIISWYQPPGC